MIEARVVQLSCDLLCFYNIRYPVTMTTRTHTHTLPQESNYFTPQGEFRVDAGGSPTLLNCLMYKMAYFRFGEVQVEWLTW